MAPSLRIAGRTHRIRRLNVVPLGTGHVIGQEVRGQAGR